MNIDKESIVCYSCKKQIDATKFYITWCKPDGELYFCCKECMKQWQENTNG